MSTKQLPVTIEPTSNQQLVDRGFLYTVYQHGTYAWDSVLAGQPFKQNCGSFHNVEEALEAYPGAEVLECNTGQPPAYLPDVPPDWFDPLNAGERWDEDY